MVWEQRFRETADLLPCIICEIDRKFRLTYANELAFELFQYTKEEFERGISVSDLLHPDDRERGGANFMAVLNGELIGPVEYRVVYKDGEVVEYQVNSSPIVHDGKIEGIRTCLFDLTDRKNAEQVNLFGAQMAAQRANEQLENLRRDYRRDNTFQNIVSRSPNVTQLFELLPQMAESSATVLISGESGTGKELVAQALHQLGPRKEKPFVAINCSALPDNLLESELFGYKAGAFTDAKKDKPGKFALADGGVIFLDEVGDVSPAMQAKLLRVLQERTYEPLGGTASVQTDVRVVAATHKDLKEMVAEGEFRQDLYYRMNVLKVHLPPLRERRSDIRLLCDHFIEKFNRRYDKEVQGMAPKVHERLLTHAFPGNVRELENILEHAFVFCGDEMIQRHHLPEELRSDAPVVPTDFFGQFGSLDDVEEAYIRYVVDAANGNRNEATRKLGLHKTTLYRKLKKYGIDDASQSLRPPTAE